MMLSLQDEEEQYTQEQQVVAGLRGLQVRGLPIHMITILLITMVMIRLL